MKLFWRIFLTFWLCTGLMAAAVLSANEFLSLRFPDDHKAAFHPEAAQASLAEAVNVYEKRGNTALKEYLQDLALSRYMRPYLVNEDGTMLAAYGAPPPIYARLAREALQGEGADLERFFGSCVLFACPIRSATGRRYAAVLTVFEPRSRLLRLRFWFNLGIAMVPSALGCMALSLYITSPITRLRATAQRLAGGDLAARSSSRGIARTDELGELGRDFDTMAGRIQQLMTAQRRFVADVSHELGAPLTRMHLALALLRRDLMGKASASLERTERETDRLSNLVQQLLLLAGLEAGRCPTETLAEVSLRSLCESVVQDANLEAEHASCWISGSREDIRLLAYPQHLRRAIDNVLRNAIRYTAAGSEILLNSG